MSVLPRCPPCADLLTLTPSCPPHAVLLTLFARTVLVPSFSHPPPHTVPFMLFRLRLMLFPSHCPPRTVVPFPLYHPSILLALSAPCLCLASAVPLGHHTMLSPHSISNVVYLVTTCPSKQLDKHPNMLCTWPTHTSIMSNKWLTNIHKLPGLSHFLLPSLFLDLQHAANGDPLSWSVPITSR